MVEGMFAPLADMYRLYHDRCASAHVHTRTFVLSEQPVCVFVTVNVVLCLQRTGAMPACQ